MLSVEIKGADELQRSLKNFSGNVAFASSRAINDTAVAVQKFEIESQLPGKLTIRSRGTPWTKPGTKYGVNIRPFASKSNLLAIVGSQADWLKLQETAGMKRVAGHRLAIPTSFWKNPKELMARSKKPRTILQATRRRKQLAGRAFIYEGTKMPAGIYARAERKRRALRMLFRLVPMAPVKGGLKFYDSGREIVIGVYQQNFNRRIAEAMATAKLKE